MEDDQKLKELMNALSFTPDDLNANRNGTLGERQNGRLRRQSWLFLIMFGTVGFALAVMFIASAKDGYSETNLSIAIGFVVTFLVIGLFGFWASNRRVSAGKVKCYVGRVTIARGDNFNWTLTVDRQTLLLSMDIRKAIDSEVEYRVYATPSGREVLALEPA